MNVLSYNFDKLFRWKHVDKLSYYADSHNGICLGFCGKDESKSKNESALYKVNYETDYPVLTQINRPRIRWSLIFKNLDGAAFGKKLRIELVD